jgi:hypothetical protein
LPFEEARGFARTLGLQSKAEWEEWCRKGERPANIPSNPWRVYEKSEEWTGV